MDIQLTAAQTADWANTQWRAGFLSALQLALDELAAPVWVVRIIADGGAQLASYSRVWQPTP